MSYLKTNFYVQIDQLKLGTINAVGAVQSVQLYSQILQLSSSQSHCKTSKICESTEANEACCVEVPNSLLELWNGEKESMVELLNESLPSPATINMILGCTKAEERIRIKACLVSKKVSKLHTHYKKKQVRKRSMGGIW